MTAQTRPVRFRFKRMAALSAAGIGIIACATLSSTSVAQRAGAPFTDTERQQGAQAHQQILAEFGDPYTGPQAAYVRTVGQDIALQTGLSTARSDFTITLLDSPVNNAFAVPGGYAYVTRQLFALMNNEAELGGVIGHELGHTYARHARQRQRAATRNSILGVLGTVLGGLLGDNGGLLGAVGGGLQRGSMQAAQAATLGFSRRQELEADDYGLRYLRGAGYDPLALSTMLASLAAQNSLEAAALGRDARSVPEWASTHPDPASRVRRAADAAGRLGGTGGRLNRDQFMAAVDNVLYGDNPRQGVVEGRQFLHPDLRLAFTAPQGFGMMNAPTAVTVSGSGGQAQFTTAAYDGSLERYIAARFQALAQGAAQGGGGQQQAALPVSEVRRTTVNGIPAAYASARANSGNTPIDVVIFAYEFAPDRAYHFVAITAAGRTATFEGMFASVRRLDSREAGAIRPRQIDVVTVARNDTVDSLARRMAFSDNQAARFRVLNGLSATQGVTPGQRVKIVIYRN